jgi:hypothetical protein
MTHNLQILAGERALQHIREKGLKPEHISMMLGASGGPKWFVLSRFDQYLGREFLSQATQPINLVGSSIGAMRMACHAMAAPDKAIQRLEDAYVASAYDHTTTPKDVSDSAEYMIKHFLGETGIEEIVHNTQFHLNVVAARARGWGASDTRFKQLTSVLASAATNMVSRRAFLSFYERVIFSQQVPTSPFRDLRGVKGRLCQLSSANSLQALMASGAIPLVLEGVRDIPGAPQGTYRDGGMIDYHFDLPLETAPGLILYPHFAPMLKPGWFDKSLPWRTVNKRNYTDVVLVTPTQSFIDRLPYGKIPDRGDFEKLETDVRQKYWHTAIAQGQAIADDFATLIDTNRIAEIAQPLDPKALA